MSMTRAPEIGFGSGSLRTVHSPTRCLFVHLCTVGLRTVYSSPTVASDVSAHALVQITLRRGVTPDFKRRHYPMADVSIGVAGCALAHGSVERA